jgi:hypothetical protein
MTIEIHDETAEAITLESLKENYANVFETLRSTLADEEFTAAYSFNFDEEVFSLIKELKALELIISNFGGTVKNVDDLLKALSEETYLAEKSFEDLKKANEILINKNHCLEEELNELKDKIKNLVG